MTSFKQDFFILCNLHVTGGSEHQIKDGLYCHPLQRQLSASFRDVNSVVIDIARQAEIADFDGFVLADENVATRQVAVHETFLRQELLKQSK